jgi:prepilin-type N-terminal cleavage/methylation domain-containing protein
VPMTSPIPPAPAASSRAGSACQRGFTLVELLLALALSALLLAALNGVTGQVLDTLDSVSETGALNRDARFAMDQIVQAVGRSPHLLVPLNDDTATAYPENINNVVAVTLDHVTDLDGNGTPDADNDGDGRFDEDPPADWTNDAAPGIYLIDDNGDGRVDNGAADSDDESATANLDPVNGIDDDNDSNTDEDPGADLNGDGCPGICGVDDDADGTVDEGSSSDDDEDGASNEDWLDPVVFYLKGTQLIRRQPVPWDVDGSGVVDGRDFIESAIADQVSRFRVERLPATTAGAVLVAISLVLTDPVSGRSVSLDTRVQVGGAL